MENGLENMLDMYLFETNTLIEQLDEILLTAENEATFSQDDINEIFRIMHTIKGSSAMMQFNPVMTVAHRIEDMFYCIRQNGVDASHKHALFDLMFKSSDFLKSQVEKIQDNEPLDDNIDDLVEEITGFLSILQAGAETGAAGAVVEQTAKAEPEQEKRNDLTENIGKYGLHVFFDEGLGMENLRAFMLVSSIRDVVGDLEFSPADVESNPETSAVIVEDGLYIKFKDEDSLHGAIVVLGEALNIKSYEIFEPGREPDAAAHSAAAETADTMGDKTEKAEVKKDAPAVAVSPAPAAAAQQTHPAAHAKQSLISVNLTKLDKLMDLVGEIVITEAMVSTNPDLNGLKLENFTKSARQLRKLTDELQSIVMSVRMVPVAGVFQKMNRIVRDIGQSLKKDVKLTIVGENTEVDKAIVDSIGDPIMHMVRNSMDHGIEENVEDRINAGKPAQAEILLQAEHTGSEVIITIADDGRGVNFERVLEKARENGILTKPESDYSAKEILELLMLPGFSTKKEATEYSGRGVGMDVVKSNIEKVGGTVLMTSEEGKGTKTVFRIPLTLAIMDGMDLSVGSSVFTVPITHIRQSFKVTNDEVVYDADRGEMIRRMENFYPIVRLNNLYGIEGGETEIEKGILIWLETGERSFCLFVDELLGEQQVVVKSLPAFLNEFNVKNIGIAGCAILGDGTISMILEVANLFETFTAAS